VSYYYLGGGKGRSYLLSNTSKYISQSHNRLNNSRRGNCRKYKRNSQNRVYPSDPAMVTRKSLDKK
jgi:hypothetical protein